MTKLFFFLPALILSISTFTASAQEQKALPTISAAASPAAMTFPHTGTVFVNDPTTEGSPLVKLSATEVLSNAHPGQNLLRAQVYLGSHSSIELSGLSASIAIKTPTPVFYVRITSDDPDLLKSRVHLIRLMQTKNRRVVTNHSQNIFGGQQAKKYDDVPITKTDVEADAWLKLTPTAPLAPGEYGIVFMPKDVNLIPDSVYDFNRSAEPSK